MAWICECNASNADATARECTSCGQEAPPDVLLRVMDAPRLFLEAVEE